MAEETLVKEALTKEMIAVGEELLRLLDKEGVSVTSAFWLYYSETGQWRLVFASPLFISEGPKQLYARIQTVLEATGGSIGLKLQDIRLMSPNQTLVKSLRSVVHTDLNSIAGVRFTGNRINDVFVDDAYIYRSS